MYSEVYIKLVCDTTKFSFTHCYNLTELMPGKFFIKNYNCIEMSFALFMMTVW